LTLRSEAGSDANILPSIFVLAIKKSDGSPEIFKARFAIDGHKYKENNAQLHTSNK
jgi:hypothetical protein